MTRYKVTPAKGSAYFIWACSYADAAKRAKAAQIEEV